MASTSNNKIVFEPSGVVYTPQETAKFGIDGIRRTARNASRSLPWPVEGEQQEYIAPVQPGQVSMIVAQTSNYKSGLMHFWEHFAANRLNEQRRYDEMIIHVSVEECVEEQAYLEFSRFGAGDDAGRLARGEIQDWSKLEQAAIQVGKIPIYRIGDSLARPEEFSNLYLTNIVKAISFLIEREKRKPAAVFVDYLQALPIDPEVSRLMIDKQRRLQVREDVYRLRKASVFFNCPFVVGVQAKQILTGARPPIMLPGMYDGEETSSIAQRADRIISLWMPKTTNLVGSRVEGSGFDFVVEEDMIWIKAVKQRGGLPAGKAWLCRVDFERNIIRLG